MTRMAVTELLSSHPIDVLVNSYINASPLRVRHFELFRLVLIRNWRKVWWLWRSGHVCAVPARPLGSPVWPLAPVCLPPTAVGSQQGRRTAPVMGPLQNTASRWSWRFMKVSRWKLTGFYSSHQFNILHFSFPLHFLGNDKAHRWGKEGCNNDFTTVNYLVFFLRTWCWLGKWILPSGPGELRSLPSCSWSGSGTCSHDWQQTRVSF